MSEHIAVAGTGAIGALMGAWLSRAGKDVTMLSVARREQAALLNAGGLTMEGYGETFHTPVRAAYLPDLPAEETFDFIFLTMKSNGLEAALPGLCAHLAPGGVMLPMQNGINDALLLRYLTPAQLVTCVTFAGGAMLAPGRYMNHEGAFFLGSAAADPAQIARAVAVAGLVRPSSVTENIRSVQWDKLCRVCLSVPTACLSGLYLGDVFLHPETQGLFAALALELFAVAAADGCPRETVEDRTAAEWRKILSGELTGLERADQFAPWPEGIVDAYTQDIRKGLPLEIDYTNGAVVRLGQQYRVPTPAHAALLAAVHSVERGQAQAGLPLLRRVKAEIMAKGQTK